MPSLALYACHWKWSPPCDLRCAHTHIVHKQWSRLGVCVCVRSRQRPGCTRGSDGVRMLNHTVDKLKYAHAWLAGCVAAARVRTAHRSPLERFRLLSQEVRAHTTYACECVCRFSTIACVSPSAASSTTHPPAARLCCARARDSVLCDERVRPDRPTTTRPPRLFRRAPARIVHAERTVGRSVVRSVGRSDGRTFGVGASDGGRQR